MGTTDTKQKKYLTSEYWKLLNLCGIMEEMMFRVKEEVDDKPDQADKADQFYFLASTIKDLLAWNEYDFLEAIETHENVERREDFRPFMSFWGFFEEKERKTMMKHAIIHTQKKENETDSFKPGNWFYDLRRSMAKKYGVEIGEGGCHVR